jgi:hypothetical protein
MRLPVNTSFHACFISSHKRLWASILFSFPSCPPEPTPNCKQPRPTAPLCSWGRDLNPANVRQLESELGEECRPSLERLKRRVGMLPLRKRAQQHLTAAAATAQLASKQGAAATVASTGAAAATLQFSAAWLLEGAEADSSSSSSSSDDGGTGDSTGASEDSGSSGGAGRGRAGDEPGMKRKGAVAGGGEGGAGAVPAPCFGDGAGEPQVVGEPKMTEAAAPKKGAEGPKSKRAGGPRAGVPGAAYGVHEPTDGAENGRRMAGEWSPSKAHSMLDASNGRGALGLGVLVHSQPSGGQQAASAGVAGRAKRLGGLNDPLVPARRPVFRSAR